MAACLLPFNTAFLLCVQDAAEEQIEHKLKWRLNRMSVESAAKLRKLCEIVGGE